MPVFDWTRTSLEMHLPDGSTTLAFDARAIDEIDLSNGIELRLNASYRPDELKALLQEYEALDESGLWANLEYFLRRSFRLQSAAAFAWRFALTIRRARSSGFRESSRTAMTSSGVLRSSTTPRMG